MPATVKEILAKHTVKDSVFTHLFGEPMYTLELYKALHPEDKTVTIADINLMTLENIMTNQPYNDLGFLVGDRILVFVECQSAWTPNILVRLLLYVSQTIYQYIEKTKQNVFSSTKLALPEPELYVIYLGERVNKPMELNLSKVFYEGRKTAIDLNAKIIYDGRQGDIIDQYIGFTKVYNEQLKLYGRTQKAVSETIRICKNKNYLKEYLQTRETEVKDIMMTIFSAERAIEARILDAEAVGEARGEARGKSYGLAQGKEEQARETALNMNKKGLSTDFIADCIHVNEATVKEWLQAAAL